MKWLGNAVVMLCLMAGGSVFADVIVDFHGKTNAILPVFDMEGSGFAVQFDKDSWKFTDSNGGANALGEVRVWTTGGETGGGIDTRTTINAGKRVIFEMDITVNPGNLADSVAIELENSWQDWPGRVIVLRLPVDDTWAKDGTTRHTIRFEYPATSPQGWFNRVSIRNYAPDKVYELTLHEFRMVAVEPKK